MKYDFTLPSSDKKVTLFLHLEGPLDAKHIVVFCHGMAEHKERYYDFIHYLNEHGFLCLIYDHRGHGASVNKMEDYGYFYDETGAAIVHDLAMIIDYVKATYQEKEVILFAHSMGTLVARNYLQNNDNRITKLVLSGPPYHNTAAPFAYVLANITSKLQGDKKRSKLIHNLAFASFDKKFEEPLKNAWINSNIDEVQTYNTNPKCGFVFTNNGFKNLFYLLKECYKKGKYKVNNPQLPILIIAGEQDPMIGNQQQFQKQIFFLKDVGYNNIRCIKYPGMRHEILNEKNKEQVYQDVLQHLEK